MGYNRSKSKTSRRVKRAKTNKRNNKRKQTFRKSRRVNRGGKGPQKQSYATSNVKSANQPTKVNAPQPNSLEAKAVQKQKNNNYDPDSKKRDNFNATKDKENYENILTNEENGDYLSAEDPNLGEVVDQTAQKEIAEIWQIIGDEIDMETHGEGEGGKIKKLTGGPLTFGKEEPPEFGGKKKRATRRK